MFVFIIILGFFAIIGISHTIMSLVYFFMSSKNETEVMLIIPKIENPDKAESILRSAISKGCKCKLQKIVCITDDFDKETMEIASYISRDCSTIRFMTKDEFSMKLFKDEDDTKSTEK
ncbi:MAG: hypothetical protein KBS62_06170 [Oscillospiraceae bacterium]|nr:hypothetical protein [Candidatus Ruminococcus equi]